MALVLRPLDAEVDQTAVQAVLEAAPNYAMNVMGKAQAPIAAADLFAALPPGLTREQKFVLGVESDGQLLGVIDVLRGFPRPEVAHIGLLLIRENAQKLGLGRRAFLALEKLMEAWREIKVLRLGVVERNSQVLGFWKAMGFSETGERKPFSEGTVRSETILLEKQKPRGLPSSDTSLL